MFSALPRLWRGLALASLLLPSSAALAVCQLGTIQQTWGGYSQPHEVLKLTDPAGQQVATFDLAWGATLTSLTYNGVEQVVGNSHGAMVQPTWFGGTHSERLAEGQFYNPETAGDNDLTPPNLRGATTHGGLCRDSNTVVMIGGTSDYFQGRGGIRHGYGVTASGAIRGPNTQNPWFGGCPINPVSPFTCALFNSPYTVTTTASFVPNKPGQQPQYYLRLTQRVSNDTWDDNQNWSFVLAAYTLGDRPNVKRYPDNCVTPAGSVSPCTASSTPILATGTYKTGSFTEGLAIATKPASYWTDFGGTTRVDLTAGGPQPGDPYPSRALNLRNYFFWLLPAGTSRAWTWWVMVGDWNQAIDFADEQ